MYGIGNSSRGSTAATTFGIGDRARIDYKDARIMLFSRRNGRRIGDGSLRLP